MTANVFVLSHQRLSFVGTKMLIKCIMIGSIL